MRRIEGISDEEMMDAEHKIKEYFKGFSDQEKEREDILSDQVWDLQHADLSDLCDVCAEGLIGPDGYCSNCAMLSDQADCFDLF